MNVIFRLLAVATTVMLCCQPVSGVGASGTTGVGGDGVQQEQQRTEQGVEEQQTEQSVMKSDMLLERVASRENLSVKQKVDTSGRKGVYRRYTCAESSVKKYEEKIGGSFHGVIPYNGKSKYYSDYTFDENTGKYYPVGSSTSYADTWDPSTLISSETGVGFVNMYYNFETRGGDLEADRCMLSTNTYQETTHAKGDYIDEVELLSNGIPENGHYSDGRYYVLQYYIEDTGRNAGGAVAPVNVSTRNSYKTIQKVNTSAEKGVYDKYECVETTVQEFEDVRRDKYGAAIGDGCNYDKEPLWYTDYKFDKNTGQYLMLGPPVKYATGGLVIYFNPMGVKNRITIYTDAKWNGEQVVCFAEERGSRMVSTTSYSRGDFLETTEMLTQNMPEEGKGPDGFYYVLKYKLKDETVNVIEEVEEKKVAPVSPKVKLMRSNLTARVPVKSTPKEYIYNKYSCNKTICTRCNGTTIMFFQHYCGGCDGSGRNGSSYCSFCDGSGRQMCPTNGGENGKGCLSPDGCFGTSCHTCKGVGFSGITRGNYEEQLQATAISPLNSQHADGFWYEQVSVVED